MSRRTTPRALLALACAGIVGAASADSLEQKLHERRPDVARWETQSLDTSATQADLAIVSLGRLGPRTPVRLADGRVRWYAVAGMRPVLVAAHAIDSGAGIQAEDATVAERDVITRACEPFEFGTSLRWRATRRLASGEALCSGDLERAPEVERDRPVTLSSQRGGVNVSRVLTAAADARAGERVRLRDSSSGATVVAIVTGSGAARVLQEQK
ncbi:MAG TPA: flagellar basal body P-ring formation chaperone FlgA [Steroidobacteraceae bacterium]|jgi:flagella basal body P-ring formation protein FlgA|nr:flagellar basal body P-ring formation chaperone FlgA [Steroidobacteraceae bacterium]